MWTSHWLPILANYSQWLSGFAIFGGLVGLYRHFTCHVDGCGRVGHRVAGTSYRACRSKHHPQLSGPTTHDDVKTAAQTAVTVVPPRRAAARRTGKDAK